MVSAHREPRMNSMIDAVKLSVSGTFSTDRRCFEMANDCATDGHDPDTRSINF